jgi:hypothetical protein
MELVEFAPIGQPKSSTFLLFADNFAHIGKIVLWVEESCGEMSRVFRRLLSGERGKMSELVMLLL